MGADKAERSKRLAWNAVLASLIKNEKKIVFYIKV